MLGCCPQRAELRAVPLDVLQVERKAIDGGMGARRERGGNDSEGRRVGAESGTVWSEGRDQARSVAFVVDGFSTRPLLSLQAVMLSSSSIYNFSQPCYLQSQMT